jgi:flagella basal body P-ring formation protein FlgA
MPLAILSAAAAVLLGAPGCVAAGRDVPAGAMLSADDLTGADCRAKAPRAPLRYDRVARTLVASEAIPAGTYLGRLAPPAGPEVRAGDVLTLRSSAGVATIERSVTALQPGRSGGKLFVRDADGQVFAVPFVAEGSE